MEPFKNKIDEKVARKIAGAIERHFSSFDRTTFLKNVKKELASLELKGRVVFLAHKLKQCLPADQKKALQILKGALQQNESDEEGLAGFEVWPLTEYVASFATEEFDQAMETLKEMTKVFTSEFAVRTFLLKDEKRALLHLREWARDENEHVRRLASEGSRPLLPWGQKLLPFVQDPLKTWELLELLKDDSSAYVRKSVANHLNDHSKNHPDFIVKKLLQWKKEAPSQGVDWVIRHATRTLIKKGHPKAFELHGVGTQKVELLLQKILSKKIQLGGALQVEIEVYNPHKKKIKAIFDHEVHLLRSRKNHVVKCFKGKVVELDPLKKQKISFNLPLRPVTTRAYYTGTHYWNIKVNGESAQRIAFFLNAESESGRSKRSNKNLE